MIACRNSVQTMKAEEGKQNQQTRIEIYVSTSKSPKTTGSLKDVYVQFIDLWLALSNINECGVFALGML